MPVVTGAPAVAAKAEELGAIAPFLVPLLATEPQTDDSSASDLALIAEAIGDAPIVGLGEYFHGTHELHRLSHRLFAYLAEKKGFDVYALELDTVHVARLNDYIHGRRDDLDTLLAAHWRYAIFYDQALLDLLNWMRAQNLEHGRQLDVAGFDLKQPDLAFDMLATRLRTFDPDLATQAETLFARIQALGGYGVFPNVSGYAGTLLIDLPPRTETQNLRVRLRARARGFDFGHGGLRADTQGGAKWVSRYLDFKAADLGDDAWFESSIEMQLPADAQRLRLILFHRGNGTLWLSGLEAEIDGEKVEIPKATLPEVSPLLFPGEQVMDYQARFDDEVSYVGAAALRIDCDSKVDDALAAGRALRNLVEQVLAEHAAELSLGEKTWLLQTCRLIEEALAWRTLVEPNRDVFLAENLSWLHREGFPGRKVFSLAHSDHSQRRPEKMGHFLAEKYGSDYFTISMFPLSGQVRDDVPPTYLERRVVPIDPQRVSSLGRRLDPLVPSNFILLLAAADYAGRDWLAQTPPSSWDPDAAYPPEIAIFVRDVGPYRLLAKN